MRPFHLHVLSAPPGFVSSVELINRIASISVDSLSALAGRVLSAAGGQAQAITAGQAIQELREAGAGLGEAEAATVVRSLSYLYRGVLEHSCDAATLGEALAQYSDVSTAAVTALQEPLSLGAKEKVSKLLSVGRLQGLDWSLGVAVQSNRCDALMTPFVRLVFKLGGSDGDVTARSVELSYSEFQDLLETFTEISAVMEKL